MGYFSFITSDTKRSIRAGSAFSGYILTPHGAQEVNYYDGYGRFGSNNADNSARYIDESGMINIYQFLAHLNFSEPELSGLNDDDIYKLGVKLSPGCNQYLKSKDGRKAMCLTHITKPAATLLGFKTGDFLFPNYLSGVELDGVYATIMDHIEAGRLIYAEFNPKVALKIVENLADYDDVSPSQPCPYQGLV